MKIGSVTAALGIFFILTGQLAAADLSTRMEAPVPPPSEHGIWGAIAYSSADEKHGFFWGADRRQEATDIALKHCQDAGGKACTVVSVFRNHRHWNDSDDIGFPYNHCGALAIGRKQSGHITPWGADSAPTRREAEGQALRACEVKGGKCNIREWVCT